MSSKRTHPSLGLIDGVYDVPLDVERLLETRMALEANSGAGKSWALRRILEQTAGHCQQIVFDPEDEFHTLREHAGYVLCSPRGGDAVADCKSAALLARRLLECNVSAIISIFELGVKRAEFVKLFLTAMVDAPRELWHPVLIAIDEAGKYCPETEKSASTEAVINLLTLGRKRGFCAVLATQRISTLNKSALAECNNIMIGRTALDIDIARAASILGMKLGDAKSILKNLDAGVFYGYGPAISREVIKFTVGAVVTTHPKAGQRAIPPAPPSAEIREILGKFADLPAEAVEEAKTVDELRAEIAKIRSANTRMATAPDVELKALRAKSADLGTRITDLEQRAQLREHHLKSQLDTADRRISNLKAGLANIRNAVDTAFKLEDSMSPLPANTLGTPRPASAALVTQTGSVLHSALPSDAKSAASPLSTDGLSKVERTFLIVIATYGPISKRDVLWRSEYARSGATDKAFTKFNRNEWTTVVDGKLAITPAGTEALGDYQPLPGPTLSAVQRAILTAIAQYPSGITKKKCLIVSGYARSGATDKAFTTLHRNGWTEGSPLLTITKVGLEILGDYERVPTGAELRQVLLNSDKLSKVERALFQVICDDYPSKVAKREALERAQYKRSGATDKAFKHLVDLGYAAKAGAGDVVANSELFT